MIITGECLIFKFLILDSYFILKNILTGVVKIDDNVINVPLVKKPFSTPPFFSRSCIHFFVDMPNNRYWIVFLLYRSLFAAVSSQITQYISWI